MNETVDVVWVSSGLQDTSGDFPLDGPSLGSSEITSTRFTANSKSIRFLTVEISSGLLVSPHFRLGTFGLSDKAGFSSETSWTFAGIDGSTKPLILLSPADAFTEAMFSSSGLAFSLVNLTGISTSKVAACPSKCDSKTRRLATKVD